MDFGLSHEQLLLQESVHRLLGDVSTLERVRDFAVNDEPRVTDIWAATCALGIAGLIIDERFGGSGLSMVDAALVAECLGNHVAPIPYLATSIIAPLAIQLAGSEQQRAEYLPKLAAGDLILGAAFAEHCGAREDARIEFANGHLQGRGLFVLDFEAAAYVVADQCGRLALVRAEAAGLERRDLITIDKTRRVGELKFNHVPAELLPHSERTNYVPTLLDHARVMLAADTLGAAQFMLDRAVAYAQEREQFGRVIGSFQAVKHMCAEMAAALEPARAMVWYAAHALQSLPSEASMMACHAKAHLAEIGKAVAKTATEVHGGIGFTELYGLPYWFKRIGFNRQIFGSPEYLRNEAARVQRLV